MRGKDIQRYRANWDGLWLIDTHNGYGEVSPINIDNYKSIKKHLGKFYPELKKRRDKGISPYHLRNCAYHAEFEQTKIVWGNIAYNNSFALLEKGVYLNAPANMITSKKLDLKYILGCLNSQIFNYEFKQIGIFLGHAFEWKKQYVEQIHIPTITSSNYSLVKNIVVLVDEIIVGRQKDNYPSATEDELNQLIYKLYNLTREEIEIIETDDC